MPTYVIEIETEDSFSDGELDELRQVVIDFASPSEGTTVTVSEID